MPYLNTAASLQSISVDRTWYRLTDKHRKSKYNYGSTQKPTEKLTKDFAYYGNRVNTEITTPLKENNSFYLELRTAQCGQLLWRINCVPSLSCTMSTEQKRGERVWQLNGVNKQLSSVTVAVPKAFRLLCDHATGIWFHSYQHDLITWSTFGLWKQGTCTLYCRLETRSLRT
jgi:hypothetical protein